MHYWAIVRYDDIRRISRDPATFRSGDGVQFADAPPEMLEASQSFLAMDAPRHSKLRGLVSSAFTPRQVARIEHGIRVNAKRIIEEASTTGGGDFVDLIAKRLPLQTISDMLGVPASDRAAFRGGAVENQGPGRHGPGALEQHDRDSEVAVQRPVRLVSALRSELFVAQRSRGGDEPGHHGRRGELRG